MGLDQQFSDQKARIEVLKKETSDSKNESVSKSDRSPKRGVIPAAENADGSQRVSKSKRESVSKSDRNSASKSDCKSTAKSDRRSMSKF